MVYSTEGASETKVAGCGKEITGWETRGRVGHQRFSHYLA